MIFRQNGYAVRIAGSYEQLPLMLSRGRFDYLSFDAHEVNSMLNEYEKSYDNLIIAPDIVIYYPFYVQLHMATKNGELVERIEYGLAIASKDGRLKKLFNEYFGSILAEMNTKTTRLFMLKNLLLTGGESNYQPSLIRRGSLH